MAKKLGGFDALFQDKPMPKREIPQEDLQQSHQAPAVTPQPVEPVYAPAAPAATVEQAVYQPEVQASAPTAQIPQPQQVYAAPAPAQTPVAQAQMPQTEPVYVAPAPVQAPVAQAPVSPATAVQAPVAQAPVAPAPAPVVSAPVAEPASDDLSIVRTFRVKKSTAMALKITAAKHELKMGEMIDDAVAFYLANHPELA